MGLPKINEKYFQCTLPISKEKINFRPFIVKEQKNFLMETENNNDMKIKHRMVYEITKTCCKENIDNLFEVDFDYLFFQLRKYSIGSEIPFSFNYKNKEKDIEEKVSTVLNIDTDLKISSENKDDYYTIINNNGFVINFEQPKIIDVISNYDDDEKDKDGWILSRMLKSVENNNEVYNDFVLQDAYKFIDEHILPKDYDKAIEFYDKNPRLYFDKKVRVEKANKEIDLSKFSAINFFLSL